MRRHLADWLLETENARPVPMYFRPFWEEGDPRGAAAQPDGTVRAR